MLHFIGLMFFCGLFMVAGLGVLGLLYNGRHAIVNALGIVRPSAPAAMPAAPSRVRIRYRSQARRITKSLRAAA